ncbi:hypothetical protein ABT095_09090 [Kitasatospora sp. NPDC002227]|uniref:hypothetical protein n=1 Tax=Kitasatospora sp. NPDC002227 TaxID=3154773 RepID=UPI00332FC75A
MLTEATAPATRLRAVRRPAPARALTAALLGYTAARLLGVLTVVLWPHRSEPGLRRLGTLWDAYWYQGIAAHGYAGTAPVPGPHGPYEAYAFFPGYPLLIRLLSLLMPPEYAAPAVAWAASLAAAWGIFLLAERLYGPRAGVCAAVLWGVLPTAVVESAAYSEPLFTAFAAWAGYAAVRHHWLRAGTLSLLAGLCRPTGLALAAAVAAAALWELLRHRAGWRALAGAALAPLGSLGFIAWVGWRKGRPDGYFRVQDAWQSHFDYGRKTFYALRDLLTKADLVFLTDVVVAATLAAAVLLFALSVVQRQPPVLLLYSAAMLTLALGDAAYFNSRARFLLPAYALLLPPAAGLARVRSRVSLALLLGSAAVLSALYGGYLVFVYPDAP